MKIKFIKECELEIVDEVDAEDDDNYTPALERFQVGEIVEGEISFGSDNDHIDFQFGDGSVAMGIPRQLFEIIDEY